MIAPTTTTSNYPAQVHTSVASDEAATGIAALQIEELVRRCSIESERFYRGQAHDSRYSYELFRRALVERDEMAWNYLFQHYSPLVESWIRRSGAFVSSGESSEYFVVGAFTKFWRAVTPERFASFPNLASLLQYLQLCASSVVIDTVRAQSWAEVMPEDRINHQRTQPAAPDEEAMQRIDQQEFWRFIDSQLHNESERVVVYGSFVLGMTPRAIFERYPALFATIYDVYNVKRNVLSRLSRNGYLRALAGQV
ncbi:MAG: sigma-70 family RNA polymerase sigma factor [Chloroflexus sp.]